MPLCGLLLWSAVALLLLVPGPCHSFGIVSSRLGPSGVLNCSTNLYSIFSTSADLLIPSCLAMLSTSATSSLFSSTT